ncbi:aldo/keto reductase [Escherichia coli]
MLYVGISSGRQSGRKKWSSCCTSENSAFNSSTFVQFTNRWVDKSGLLDTLQNNGVGCIAFTPLAQGLLTGKYLNGIRRFTDVS